MIDNFNPKSFIYYHHNRFGERTPTRDVRRQPALLKSYYDRDQSYTIYLGGLPALNDIVKGRDLLIGMRLELKVGLAVVSDHDLFVRKTGCRVAHGNSFPAAFHVTAYSYTESNDGGHLNRSLSLMLECVNGVGMRVLYNESPQIIWNNLIDRKNELHRLERLVRAVAVAKDRINQNKPTEIVSG